jgi:two-component system, NarL family, sensor histidine kinase DevS
VTEVILTREQLEERLAALHRASLEVVKDISLETLLNRIAVVACQQVDAQYAALGVLNEDGALEKFIPIGMEPETVQRMAHPPVGRGLIGALMNSTEAIRLARISDDPRSSGFPDYHPPMESFLGVPIRLGDKQVGQIYLTNKQNAPEFTQEDQRVIEMLASYAAIAISNARSYEQLSERDTVLTRRNENLALLNELASTLATSDDIDQVLDKVLTQVLDYLRLEVGEVFLRQEDGRVLQLMMRRGEPSCSLWSRKEFNFGEGLVGKTAESNQLSQVNLEDFRQKTSGMGTTSATARWREI